MTKNRVEGHQNLFKDMDSGVIVNREMGERDRYRTAKQHALDNINSKAELAELKEEMNEIKQMLKQFLNT